MAKGILIAAMDFSDVAEDEFHDWYDTEHVPERLRVPGFLNAERWIGSQNPKISLALYDRNTVGVLHSPAYLAVGGDNGTPWTKRVTGRTRMIIRLEGEQIRPGDALAPAGANALLLIAMNVVPEQEGEFNEWYNTEHLPQLGAAPGVLAARATVAPARRSAMRLSIISPIPMYRIHKPGRARPTRRGPSVCGRISATFCASTPAATLEKPDLPSALGDYQPRLDRSMTMPVAASAPANTRLRFSALTCCAGRARRQGAARRARRRTHGGDLRPGHAVRAVRRTRRRPPAPARCRPTSTG